ncbi:MAG TPA: PQQ-dependent sugar dehydrogenase [Vicinamibacterales bacterium]|nr:PQQ-dependent sugar dehydrogenase [Vicinamibacterales bacterium]
MKSARTASHSSLLLTVGVVVFGALALAQQNAVQPQPQADKLPAPGTGSPKLSQTTPRPEGAMPQAPAGFTVTAYADIDAPRMMVYAPNGDLFVSSPAANTITVLRDANNDGVFEERSVYAAGPAPARRGGGGGFGAPGGRPGAGPGARAGAAPGAATNAATPAPPAPATPAAPAPAAGGAAPAPAAAPPAPGGAAPAPGGAGAPGGQRRGGGAGGVGGRGAPSILGANAPACAAPPAFVQSGPGVVQAPFGLAFHGDYLYVGNTGSLVRFKYKNGDLKAQGEPEKLMDLPTGGHSTRNVLFNRAGTKMYVAVGSSSNNDAGEDCRRAAILEFNPDGSGYRVFASGIRNPVGLALQPGTDTLWTAMNERDNYGDDLVPDYATSVKDGGFYGWPYSYIGKNYDPRYIGSFPDLVNRAIVPDVLIPAHSAALGITFYTGNQFPQRYRNGAFVALHGSWNRSSAAGYKVIFFPMNNGKPGPIEDFLTGFLSSDGTKDTPIVKWGTPVGVTVARDGALLVSDDAGNRIWKISARK